MILLNEERPAIWEQVGDWIDRFGFITNHDVCKIANIDTLKASRILKRWVENGTLTVDMSQGKRRARYRKRGVENDEVPIFSLSTLPDNKTPDND